MARSNLKGDLSRVIVIGSAGAGKTTFARSIADTLGIPHIELDAIFWEPNWLAKDRDEFREMVAKAVTRDRWVVDGNYSMVQDIVWPRATTAVWLNYPFRLVFGRVFWRTVQRVVTREELFAGNRESFRKAFLSRESLLWWVITSHTRRRKRFRVHFDTGTFPNLSLIEFGRPNQAKAYLHALSQREDRKEQDKGNNLV